MYMKIWSTAHITKVTMQTTVQTEKKKYLPITIYSTPLKNPCLTNPNSSKTHEASHKPIELGAYSHPKAKATL